MKLNVTQAELFGTLALDCVHREFPNKISHSLNSYQDVKPPRELTPAFFGCYDWHSAVHNHWALARLARLFSDAPFALHAKRALNESITNRNIAQEVHYLNTEGREAFERPYGLAWLLQLAAELKEWDAPEARELSANLSPLEIAVTNRLAPWLSRLHRPVRTGEHNNTAFAMGLMLDYARITGHSELRNLVESRARDFYFTDENCPLSYEPSGEDFFSPCLAEADLMRRLLPSGEFTSWFNKFLPHIHLDPTYPSDAMDGKLGHLIGLNLSRAWMLEGVVSKLPAADARSEALSLLAGKLTQAGLSGIQSDNYQGAHWLGTFAVYLLSARGFVCPDKDGDDERLDLRA